MKIIKKIVSITIILSMILSLAGVYAFADEPNDPFEKYRQGSGYVAIGDSITRGCNGENDIEIRKIDNYVAGDGEHKCRNVRVAFSKAVADALGLYSPENIKNENAQYWPLAVNAETTAFMMGLLGIEDTSLNSKSSYQPFQNMESIMLQRYNTMLYYFGNENSRMPDGGYVSDGNHDGLVYGQIKNIDSLIEDATVITIELGLSDCFYSATRIALAKFEDDPDLLSDKVAILNALKELSEEMRLGYEYWYKNFPLLLDYIKEHAGSDCEVIVLGAINPLQNMTLTEDSVFPIGTLLSSLTDSMNIRYKYLSNKYGFKYIDIANVETASSSSEVSIMDLISAEGDMLAYYSHPTEEGYR